MKNLYLLNADQIIQLLQKLEEDGAITIEVDLEDIAEALKRFEKPEVEI